MDCEYKQIDCIIACDNDPQCLSDCSRETLACLNQCPCHTGNSVFITLQSGRSFLSRNEGPDNLNFEQRNRHFGTDGPNMID